MSTWSLAVTLRPSPSYSTRTCKLVGAFPEPDSIWGAWPNSPVTAGNFPFTSGAEASEALDEHPESRDIAKAATNAKTITRADRIRFGWEGMF
ncbi:hypothetical protein [uncultured Varibaculum sp.]|uniref:hypothetical protein n=1 Tax=uncultured Varibaculum sp. TaxID=413896 RepID=UPI00258B5BAC|nr:hypothetical protein [uncultured Varibaculum sp.]